MSDGPPDFLRDTRVERAPGPGLYRCTLGDDWSAAVYPFGGFVSALALRAMQAELGRPEHRLRTATTVFASPVAAGPVEIRVRPLRLGKRMSHLEATVRNVESDDAGHLTLAIFGEDREAFTLTDLEPPHAPPPERCPPPVEPPPESSYRAWRATFFEQIEVRRVRMHAPWETDWVGERAEAVRWLRYRRPPRLADGTLDPLALVAVADTMPPAIGQKLGPGYPFFFAPSCDLTVRLHASTSDDWLLLRTRCSHADEGYASGFAEVWDTRGRLLAEATQLMFVRMGGAG